MHRSHRPVHRFSPGACYIVTASTYHKEHLFAKPDRLDFLQNSIAVRAEQFEFELLAWALFSNHYHVVIQHHGGDDQALKQFVRHVHGENSVRINREDGITGRSVFYQYWDTELTSEKSKFARMNYVMHNPVRHGLVPTANLYSWCSESWFMARQPKAYYERIKSFPVDSVNVRDDFEPLLPV